MRKNLHLLKTLQGKTGFMLCAFIAVFLFFAFFIYRQNLQLSRLYEKALACNEAEAMMMNHFRFYNLSQVYALEKMNYGKVNVSFENNVLQEIGKLAHNAAPELRRKLDAIETRESMEGKLDTIGQAWQELYEVLKQIKVQREQAALDTLAVTNDSHFDLDAYYRARFDDLSVRISVMFHLIYGVVLPAKTATTQELERTIQLTVVWVVVLALATGIVCTLTYWSLRKALRESLGRSTRLLQTLSVGCIPKPELPTEDELGVVIEGANQLAAGLEKASHFAAQVGKGNLNEYFQPMSAQDVLGNALLTMRDGLKEYQRKEQKQNWAATGLAEFAEVLRTQFNSLEELSFRLISRLVKYIGANQGGVFVYEHGEKVLQLRASYAYERRKYLSKQIRPGQGLVGQCFLEADVILLTDIPGDYLQITSGLGEATPTVLLLVPITQDNQVEGVIELASFRVFTPNEVAFVQKVAQNVGSVLTTVRGKMLTEQLLEQSQQQAGELKAQEEEMRQNLEELHATQEAARRREEEYLLQISQLEEENRGLKNKLAALPLTLLR